MKSVVSSVKHNFCLTEQLGGLNRITYMNCLTDKNSVNGSYYYSLYAEFLYVVVVLLCSCGKRRLEDIKIRYKAGDRPTTIVPRKL